MVTLQLTSGNDTSGRAGGGCSGSTVLSGIILVLACMGARRYRRTRPVRGCCVPVRWLKPLLF